MIGLMKRKGLSLEVGDAVWVPSHAIKLEGNLKLMPKWLGSFDMMEVHHNAYQLCFPDTIRVHPIIDVSFLKPVIPTIPSDLPHAVKAPVVHDNVYEVDRIVDHCLKGCQWQALVK